MAVFQNRIWFLIISMVMIIPGIIFLILGLGFTAWTIQIYSVEQQIITNISLIGIGCIVLGAILLMTAIILFSLVTVVKEK